MQQTIDVENHTDSAGNPSGGSVRGVGLSIDWQNGALGRDEGRIEPNGAFVETVILAARRRLEYYQRSKFRCDENAQAIEHLNEALTVLGERTERREAAGVEGTMETMPGETPPEPSEE